MAQQSSTYRKIFVDSRWRSSGTHGDFTIELPRDVDTTRTSSVYVASCSFSNTFSTIEPGVNDELYALTENAQAVPPISEDSRWLYGLYQRDQLVRVAAGAEFLYLLVRFRSGSDGSFQYRYTMATLMPGSYEVAAFAGELQRAVRAMVLGDVSTVTWRPASESYEIVFTRSESDIVTFFIPSDRALRAAVGAPNSRFAPEPGSSPLWPPPGPDTVNGLLSIPDDFVAPGGAFSLSAIPFATTQRTGRVPTERPVRGIRADLLIRAPPAPLGIAALAEHLQFHLRFWFQTMVVTATGERELSFDTGTLGWTLRLVSDAELRDPAWRAANWPGPAYDAASPRSYNAQLGLRGPSALARRQTIPAIPPAREAWVFRLAKAQYPDGADLAAALEAAMRPAAAGVSVAFDGDNGVLVFASAPPTTLRIPTERELRRADWRAANWDPYPANGPDARYDLGNPTSLNGQLYMPSPSEFLETTTSGNVDLVPYREVYLASSITNYRTLQSGTAAMDIMARIPIDVNYGQVVVYRHLGPADALSASDMHFRTVRFTFRDWAGRVVPMDQPAIIELAFVDSDPFSM